MEIRINLKIFAFIIIFYITGQINIYGVVMLFAFLHECGHLLTGCIMGFKPKSLSIMPLGIAINFAVFPREYNKKILKANYITLKKLIIAMAGPIVNLVLAILFCIFPNSILGISSENIVYANILIAIFNLIPIYPLDGGRIVKYILNIYWGLKESNTYINKISNIVVILITMISSIGIYYYKNIAILFILAYLWILVIIQNKRYNMKMNIYKAIEKMKCGKRE